MQQSKSLFYSFRRSIGYTPKPYGQKPQSNGLKYAVGLSCICYLYFQEDLLQNAMTKVQEKYLRYQLLLQQNREAFEVNEQRKKLNSLFDPEPRIDILTEKVGRQLDALEPFAGDFLQLSVKDKFRDLKRNEVQVYFSQKGSGKTLEALRMAKEWKQQEEGPVLLFDGDDFSSTTGGFQKYGISDMAQLKKVLKEHEVEVQPKFDLEPYFERLTQMIPPVLASHFPFHIQQKKIDEPIIKEKPLLILIDDADELKSKIDLDQAPTNRNQTFLLQLKELSKEGHAKLLFFCNNRETKTWLEKTFGANSWQGINRGHPGLKSHSVVEKYLSYVGDLTGIKMPEAEKFFFYFGVDYNALIELKRYLQKHRAHTSQKNGALNIDGFIQNKVEESQKILQENELDKIIMKACPKIDKDWQNSSLTQAETEKLEDFLGADGTSPFKYKAAAYSLCGKSWKDIWSN